MYTYTLNGITTTPFIDNGLEGNNATFTNLISGETYDVIVIATNSFGETSSSIRVSLLIPTNVYSVIFSNISYTSFRASWKGGNGATSYTYILNGQDANGIGIGSTYVESDQGVSLKYADFTNLSFGQTYSLIVQANNLAGFTSSDLDSVTMLAPEPPVNLEFPLIHITRTGFQVSWSGAMAATSYKYMLNGLDASMNLVNDQGLASNYAEFANLIGGQTYSVIVASYNSAGFSLSAPSSVTLLIPTQPISIDFSNITQTGFQINWLGGDDATRYTYTLNGLDAYVWNNLETNQGVSSKYAQFAGLESGGSYSLIITATNFAGSISSESVSITLSVPSEPTSIEISNITQIGFQVNWSGGLGAINYMYTLNELDNSGNIISTIDALAYLSHSNVSTDTKYAAFTNLISGGSYTLEIQATNLAGSSSVRSPQINLLVPTDLVYINLTNITPTSFVINWSGGLGATYTYNLNYYDTSGNLQQNTDGLTYLSDSNLIGITSYARFTNLLSGGSYTIAIQAYNYAGNTNTILIPVALSVPTEITPISILSLTQTQFHVRWQGADGATRYTYILNGIPAVPSLDEGLLKKFAIFTGFDSGEACTLVIRAYNEAGYRDSILQSFNLLAPSPITNVSITNVTRDSFNLNWSGGYGSTSYRYTLNGVNADASGYLSNDQGLANNYAEFENLPIGQRSTLIISAFNKTGTTVSNPVIVRLLAPPKPFSVYFSNVTESSFEVSWSQDYGATSYMYVLNGKYTIPTLDNGIASKYAQFTNLSYGTKYILVIEAHNLGGVTVSNMNLVTTLSPLPPSLIQSVTLSNIGQTSFQVSWTGGTRATRYAYTLNNISTLPSNDQGVRNQYAQFINLSSGDTYTLSISAYNLSGTSYSKEVSFQLLVPTKPVPTIISCISLTSVSLYWTGGIGATKYLYSINGEYRIPSNDQGVASKYATFENIRNSSSYIIIIHAINYAGESISDTTVLLSSATKPYNLQYTLASNRTIRLTWSGGVSATSYVYRINGNPVVPLYDMGLEEKYAILSIPSLSTVYKITVVAVKASTTVSSDELSVLLHVRPVSIFKKTIVCVYTSVYPFLFGEFVSGILYLLKYASNNHMTVRLNIENTLLENYLIVDNYRIPPGKQTKVYYNDKDSTILMDDLQAFKQSSDPILLVTTNLAINRNEIDRLIISEFNNLIQFNTTIYTMMNERLQRDILNSVIQPSYTDPYIVLNVYLKDICLNRAQIQSLAAQIRASLNLAQNHIVITSNSYLRSTLTELLGGFRVLGGHQTQDSLDALESSLVDYLIISRSKKIYTFSEYNSKVKRIAFEESTSLTTVTISDASYISTTFADIFTINNLIESFSYPCGISEDLSGNVYVADTMNNTIRQIQTTGVVRTLPNTDATLSGPTGITVDANGNAFVVDAISGLIRKIDTSGNVTTIAGSTAGFQDGQGTAAQFKFLYG